jgi:hypothetical protein
MRITMALVTAALLTLAVIVGLVARTTFSTDQAKAGVSSANSIDVFDFMKKSNGLPHQQYDAY